MNKNINNENLIYSLPDYITGKLNDEGLKFRIAEEIRNNNGFRQEYELLKETYSSLKNLEFSEPPAHYFNNLVPRLNQRIENESKFSFAHLFRLANLFKYALPAVTVVCVILLITFTNKSNKDENMFIQSDNTISEIMKGSIDSTTAVRKKTSDSALEENDVANNTADNTIQESKVTYIKKTNNNTAEISPGSVNIEDLLTESDESEDDDAFMYENEFTTLSKTEQSDIISKLTKENF
jgi:hypothetical protein